MFYTLNMNIDKVIELLKKENSPRSEFVRYMEDVNDPFLVLISCILSLRTKDETTYPATLRMLELGRKPKDFASMQQEILEKAIYPVGFYRNKANSIINISKILKDKYNSHVPNSIEELTKLNGVGRKTANLTLAKGFKIPAICVDVHVHRICNRWGYVSTKTPDDTEMELRKKLPEKYWLDINTLLVTHGQNICKPINPQCLKCPVSSYCAQKV